MSITINMTGANASELYTISEPANLMNFCNYDFSDFSEKCINLSKKYSKSGIPVPEEMLAARNSIANCHKFFENNLRSTYDKIVVDFWIDYICRTNEINTASLWNSFINCRTPFEKAIFMRLSEYRSKKAKNEWVNLLKLQEYAVKKVDFVFGAHLDNANEAACRANAFDLMFNIVANEQGYSLDTIGSVRLYKVGRLPNSPFVMSSASKELMRNVLGRVHFNDEAPAASKNEGILSDQEAMEAFALIKNYIPEHNDNVANTIVKSLSSVPRAVFLPSSLKSCIDLEMDQIIESGAYLQRCQRCKQLYLREPDYDYDYCDRITSGGKTCLEIMGKNNGEKRTAISADEIMLLKTKADNIYREMNDRVGADLTQRDMSEWFSFMTGIKNHVMNGEATIEDFENFIEYSRSMSFAKKIEVKQEQANAVKPYQFQRVDRRELERQGLISKPSDDNDITTAAFIEAITAVPSASSGANAPSAPVRIIRGNAAPQANVFEQSFDTIKSQPTSVLRSPEASMKHTAFSGNETKPNVSSGGFVPEKPPELKPFVKYEKRPVENSVFEVHEISDTSAEEKKEAAGETPSKNPRVFSAYKTVTRLPRTDVSLEETDIISEKHAQPSIDFMEILQGIERNDGFEEENIPLDSDGVPISHKTKRVMDALMKPSKASPSLRRPPNIK